MKAGNAEGWQTIIAAANMRRENRETIASCEKAAQENKRPTRCLILIGNK